MKVTITKMLDRRNYFSVHYYRKGKGEICEILTGMLPGSIPLGFGSQEVVIKIVIGSFIIQSSNLMKKTGRK